MKFQTFLLCFFAVLNSVAVLGQGDTSRQISALEAIDVLKKGTLVVRLSTNTRKIAALEKMVATSESQKDRQRFEKMLDKTLEDTRKNNLWLMEAFRASYSYSRLLFMPDTAATKLKMGVRKGIFLNPGLQVDPSLALEGGFLVAFNGVSSSDQKTSNEGINVLDYQLQPLESPFPFFTGRTSIRRIFEALFNKSSDLDHYSKLVAKFQQKLVEFGG